MRKNLNYKNNIDKRIQIMWGNETHVYVGVPIQLMKSVLYDLKDFEDDSISSDEFFTPLLKEIGGEPAYQMSALTVKSSRTGSGMTQKKLADLLDVDKGNLSKIEHAKRPVGKTLAKKLSKIFNTDYKIYLSDLPD